MSVGDSCAQNQHGLHVPHTIKCYSTFKKLSNCDYRCFKQATKFLRKSFTFVSSRSLGKVLESMHCDKCGLWHCYRTFQKWMNCVKRFWHHCSTFRKRLNCTMLNCNKWGLDVITASSKSCWTVWWRPWLHGSRSPDPFLTQVPWGRHSFPLWGRTVHVPSAAGSDGAAAECEGVCETQQARWPDACGSVPWHCAESQTSSPSDACLKWGKVNIMRRYYVLMAWKKTGACMLHLAPLGSLFETSMPIVHPLVLAAFKRLSVSYAKHELRTVKTVINLKLKSLQCSSWKDSC